MRLFSSAKIAAIILVGALAVLALGLRFTGATEKPSASPRIPDSLDWVRQEIVGTWKESDKTRKWVFRANGTLRKYQDGELVATTDYEIVSECKEYKITSGEFEPMAILKETSPDGRVSCNSVKNMKKSGDGGAGSPPFLLVGTQYGVYNFQTYSSPQ